MNILRHKIVMERVRRVRVDRGDRRAGDFQ